MDSTNVKHPDPLGSFSRRGFLTAATVAAAASRPAPIRAASGRVVAYVGAYTDKDKNALYIYDLDPADGTLTRRVAFQDFPSPSSLAIAPNQKFLYAVNEISNFNGTRTGSVTAFSRTAG